MKQIRRVYVFLKDGYSGDYPENVLTRADAQQLLQSEFNDGDWGAIMSAASIDGGKGYDVNIMREKYGSSSGSTALAEEMSMLGMYPQISFEDQLKNAKEMAQQNMEMFPEISGISLNEALGTAGSLDKFLSDRFYSNLEGVLPEWRNEVLGTKQEMLGSVSGIARDYLSGEIPADVRDEIMRTRAELGIQRGLFGEAQNYATARDLGLTSLDLQSKGIGLAGISSQMAGDLLNTAFALTPPVSDPTALFTQNLGLISGAGMPSAGQILDVSSRTAMANAEYQWASQLSQANMGLDLYQTQMQMQMNERAISAQQDASQASMWGSIASAGLMAGGMFLGNPGLMAAGAGGLANSNGLKK